MPKTVTGLLAISGLIVAGWLLTGPAAAQSPAAQGAAANSPTADPYQRSYEIYTYQASGVRGTAQHGEELYYIKCWYCHNQYARTGPQLRDLFKRSKLLTGQAVTVQSVGDKIMNGSPNLMPAYKTVLDEVDLRDLVNYIKSERCCFDAEEPPPNPRYKVGR